MLNCRLILKSVHKAAHAFINRMSDYPDGFRDRGVICLKSAITSSKYSRAEIESKIALCCKKSEWLVKRCE